MIIRRIWAMPNKWTFDIKPIGNLIQSYVHSRKHWVDPFSGWNSPAEITNDLNPICPAKSHIDALEFVRALGDNSAGGCLFDPPYSLRQVKECYEGLGRTLTYKESQDATFGKVKDELSRIVESGGIAICCGWNSNGFGKNRGFEIIEILLVPHGGHHNDTIVTVERKIKPQLVTTVEL